jgi:hypothetical protein
MLHDDCALNLWCIQIAPGLQAGPRYHRFPKAAFNAATARLVSCQWQPWPLEWAARVGREYHRHAARVGRACALMGRCRALSPAAIGEVPGVRGRSVAADQRHFPMRAAPTRRKRAARTTCPARDGKERRVASTNLSLDLKLDRRLFPPIALELVLDGLSLVKRA